MQAAIRDQPEGSEGGGVALQPRGDLPLHCYLYCAEHCKEEIVNQLLMAEWKYAPKGVSACKQRSGDGDLALHLYLRSNSYSNEARALVLREKKQEKVNQRWRKIKATSKIIGLSNVLASESLEKQLSTKEVSKTRRQASSLDLSAVKNLKQLQAPGAQKAKRKSKLGSILTASLSNVGGGGATRRRRRRSAPVRFAIRAAPSKSNAPSCKCS